MNVTATITYGDLSITVEAYDRNELLRTNLGLVMQETD